MFFRLLAIACLLLLPFAGAGAKQTFRTFVPNGNTLGCPTCHISTLKPVSWNAFGLDVKATLVNKAPEWSAVCDLDSDDDGFANGEELLDPACGWAVGTPSPGPSSAVTKPGDPNSFPKPVAPEPEPLPEPAPEVGPEAAPVAEGVAEALAEPPPPVADALTGEAGVATATGNPAPAPAPAPGGGGCRGGGVASGLALAALLALVAWRAAARRG